MTLFVSVVIFSCQKEEEPFLEVLSESKSISYGSLGGVSTLNFSTNQSWQVVVTEDWLKLSSSKGDPGGDIIIDITCIENDTYESRTSEVALIAGRERYNIQVSQSSNYGIVVDDCEYHLSPDAQQLSIELQSNVEYEVFVPDSAASWLSCNPTKSLSWSDISFSIAENTTYYEREAHVLIKQIEGDIEIKLLISQKGRVITLDDINELYSWMVTFGTSGQSSHDDFGHLGCTHILDLMGQDIAINGTWNCGSYDIIHDYGLGTWTRPYLLWNFYYTLIDKTNKLINCYDRDLPKDDFSKAAIGQAYALRAMSYTYLIQIFQDTVEGTTPNAIFRDSAPAVPIIYNVRDAKTEEEQIAVMGRNTLADLKVEIERNFNLSFSLLKGYDRGADKNQINYQTAQGLAARYYLLTQQWDKAIIAAQEAQKGFDVMDKTRLMSGFNEIHDGEVIWGFDHTSETQTNYASFFSHISNDCYGYGGIGQSVHCIDASLYKQIPESDYRKALFNTHLGDVNATTVGAKLPYAARKFGYAVSWLQDYIFMRNSEMILIEAEAHARLNDGDAKEALSKLMINRDPSWSDSNVTIEDILLQRRIELWGEGFEYFDLRRNGLGVDRRYEGTNHSKSAQYFFPAHAKSWNFQIPESVMQNNPYIKEEEQNEWVSGTVEF